MPRLLVPPVVLGLLALASAAAASPSLSVVSPTPGPLSTDQPTITVVYSSDDPGAPLDLVTLRILVNGSDWTGKFTQSAGSANYDVSAQDAFAAGRITIEASISDVVGGLASAAQPYDLVPTIRAIAPVVARPGDELTLEVVGLDPSAANNIAVFPSAFVRWPQGAEVAFASVDHETKRGIVVVPAGAITGSVSVLVNDVVSAGGPNLTILGDFDICGYYAWKMISLASGRMAVLSVGCALAGFNAQGAVTLQDPGEPMVLVTATPWNDPVYIVTIAADKAGNGPAVISGRVLSNSPLILETIVKYKGTESRVAMTPGPFRAGADFDSEGNLYLTASIGASGVPDLYLVRLSAQDLARGGAIGYTTVAQLPVSDPFRIIRHRGLSVSCEGRAYIGIGTWARGGAIWEGEVREIDLATGAVTNTMALGGLVAGDFPLFDLALTGNPGELLGSSIVASDWLTSDVEVWRGVMGQQARTRVAFLPNNLNPTHVTVAPNGDIYANLNDDVLPLGYKVQVVDPCPGAACPPPRSQPYCNATPPAQIEVLPSTTRWKPQRSDDPITVDFMGPDNLDLASGVLEITGPAGPITVSAPITVTSPTGPFTYRMQWTGPWTYTDPADGQEKRLPPGNYPVVVVGTTGTAPNQQTLRSAPYDKVSLVEVAEVTLTAPPNTPALATNTGPGGGDAIFAEAEVPGGTVYDVVQLTMTLTPPVADASSGKPLVVHVRAYDVDDPSSTIKAIDDEAKPTDNRGDATAGLLNVLPTAGASPTAAIGADLSISPSAAGDVAKAWLRVSRRQGDNYRLAASTYEPWLGKLSSPPKTTDARLQHSENEPLTEGQQVTKLLTVWRTLNVEVDQLSSNDLAAVQKRMDVEGDFSKLEAKKLTDEQGPFRNVEADATTLNDWVLHTKDGDWVGADLTLSFHANDVYDVSGNGKKTVDVKLSPNQPDLLNGQEDPAITNRKYVLRDDYLDVLSTEAPDTTLASSLLARAYIRFKEAEQPADQKKIPFVIDKTESLDRRHLTFYSLLRLPAEVVPSDEFWSVSLVGVFNGNPKKDLDPQTEVQLNLGYTDIGLYRDAQGQLQSGKLKATVFLETLRDVLAKSPAIFAPLASKEALNQRATAHELLHTLKVPHGDAIMCANVMVKPDAAGGEMTADQVAILRGLERPTKSQSKSQTCEE